MSCGPASLRRSRRLAFQHRGFGIVTPAEARQLFRMPGIHRPFSLARNGSISVRLADIPQVFAPVSLPQFSDLPRVLEVQGRLFNGRPRRFGLQPLVQFRAIHRRPL